MKKLARKILEKYEVNTVTVKTLKNIINAQGYTVIFYSSNDLSSEQMRLIKTLGIVNEATFSNSLTYSERDRRIVFIKKDLSDDELLYFLSLELGKILSCRVQTTSLLAENASDLIRAHEFAYHLTSSQKHGTFFHLIKYYPIQSAISAVVLFISFLVLSVFATTTMISSNNNDIADTLSPTTNIVANYENNNDISVPVLSVQESESASLDSYEESEITEYINDVSSVISDDITNTGSVYFATPNGKKYHLSDCSYISEKQTVSVSQNDIDNGKYTACSRCIG